MDFSRLPMSNPSVESSRLPMALRHAGLSDEQYTLLAFASLNYAKFGAAPFPVGVSGHTASERVSRSRMLSRLEARGLIHRLSTTPTKTRTTHIRVTDAGRALLDRIGADLGIE